MPASPEFLKAMQDLDNEALQGLRERAAKSQAATEAFTGKAVEMMGAIDVSGNPNASATDKQKPAAIDGIDAEGGNGIDAPKPG